MQPTTIELIAAILFALAIAHTFSAKFFEKLALRSQRHAGLWHLLGEVEVVFGFWATLFVILFALIEGTDTAVAYLDGRDFTEPLFIFVIMVMAATRPVLRTASAGVDLVARLLPIPQPVAVYLVTLTLVPLLGSFITEPGAMTVAALLLAQRFFSRVLSPRLRYATIGVLFVNVSIGGVLTPYAAPPVLMVAGKWGWGLHEMLVLFGWKAALAVLINGLGAAILFAGELTRIELKEEQEASPPRLMVLIHILFLTGVVVFSHHPVIFVGLFLIFLGIASAYPRYQDVLILREGLLVALFLSGLIVLGGMQHWWLQPLLTNMSENAVFVGATALTAVTDNAALTYLGSLVDGLSDGFKYLLVAGAVTGGGLTVIANAPNPAGMAILRPHFEEQEVHPGGLLLAALIPTLVAALAFRFL